MVKRKTIFELRAATIIKDNPCADLALPAGNPTPICARLCAVFFGDSSINRQCEDLDLDSMPQTTVLLPPQTSQRHVHLQSLRMGLSGQPRNEIMMTAWAAAANWRTPVSSHSPKQNSLWKLHDSRS